MLTPQRKAQMDAVIGGTTKNIQQTAPTLTPERRKQMDSVLNKPSIGGFINNIGTSAENLVTSTASAIAHPIDTAKGMYQLGSGVISKFIPGRQKSEDTADAVGKFYKDRYGGVENIKNTLYNDPIGALADVSTVISGVGAGAGLAGKVGTASKLSKVASLTDPLQATVKAVGATTRPLTKFFPKMIENLPKADDLVMRGVGNPTIQKKMIVPAEKIVPKYNLWERTPEAVTEVIKDLNKKRQGAIEGAGSTANLQDLLKPLDDAILGLKNNKFAMKSDTAKGQLNEMMRRRQDLIETFSKPESVDVPNLVDTSNKQSGLLDDVGALDQAMDILRDKKSSANAAHEAQTTISRLQEGYGVTGENPIKVGEKLQKMWKDVGPGLDQSPITTSQSTNLNPKVKLSDYDAFRREAIDPDVPQGAFDQALSQNKAKDAGAKTVRRSMASKVDELAGTKDMGKDLQSLYKLRDVFEGYQTRVKNRQTVNVHKMGGGILGGSLAGAKGAITGFLVEQIVNSPKGLEMMYKVAKGVEKGAFGKKLGKASILSGIEKELAKYNLPNTKEIAKMIYNYGRAGRMTNQ